MSASSSARPVITDAKIVGRKFITTTIPTKRTVPELASLPCQFNTEERWIEVRQLSFGEGNYLVVAIVDGVIQDIANTDGNTKSVSLTPWAQDNGWKVSGMRIQAP